MLSILTYLEGEPEANDEGMVDETEEFDLGADVPEGVLLEAGLLVHVLHGVDGTDAAAAVAVVAAAAAASSADSDNLLPLNQTDLRMKKEKKK